MTKYGSVFKLNLDITKKMNFENPFLIKPISITYNLQRLLGYRDDSIQTMIYGNQFYH